MSLQVHEEGEVQLLQHQSQPPDHFRLLNAIDRFHSIRKMEIKLLLVRRGHGDNVDMEIMWKN
jgi:hypothetical protein